MRKIIFVLWTVIMVTMVGCAGNREVILKASTQTQQDVFHVADTSQIVPGKALLKINFPVKTYKGRLDGIYLKHSKPDYTAIINIDGQPIELTAEPFLEDLPGDFREYPEAGTGWKYVFKKTLQLEPGSHRITIAVPLSNVVVEKTLTVKQGENQLKLDPIYNASVSRYPHYPRFSKGLRGVDMQLNSSKP